MIISLINVEDLTDRRLKYEFKYIMKIVKKAKEEFKQRGSHSFVNSDNFPLGYVTGMACEIFFFNKLKYIYRRHNELLLELGERKLISEDKLKSKIVNMKRKRKSTPEHMWNDYNPSDLDMRKSIYDVINNRNKTKYNRKIKEIYSKYL